MVEHTMDQSVLNKIETLVHEEGVDMPTAAGEARIEIDATALTVHNLVSDSNCMVQ